MSIDKQTTLTEHIIIQDIGTQTLCKETINKFCKALWGSLARHASNDEETILM